MSRLIPVVLAATVAILASPAPRAAAIGASPDPALLPAPQPVTRAVDISPRGVIVGEAVAPDGPGSPGAGRTAQRWIPAPGGYVRQQLGAPDGTGNASPAGVTDLAEAGGTIWQDADGYATRWSADGRRTARTGAAGSATHAVGPAQWLVRHDAEPKTLEVVSRDGARVPVVVPNPAFTSVTGASVAGPQTALVVGNGGSRASLFSQGVVWQEGTTVELPVYSSARHGYACHSDVLPDGTVAFSGPDGTGDGARPIIGVRRGGVTGTTAALPTDGLIGHVGCYYQGQNRSDTLSRDGWVAGGLADPQERTRMEPALWRPDGTLVRPGLAEVERSGFAVAVATGGRAVIRATLADGTANLSLWHRGGRTPLPIPAGWTLSEVVEFTDRGVVLANLTNADGQRRPVVWFTRSGGGSHLGRVS